MLTEREPRSFLIQGRGDETDALVVDRPPHEREWIGVTSNPLPFQLRPRVGEWTVVTHGAVSLRAELSAKRLQGDFS